MFALLAHCAVGDHWNNIAAPRMRRWTAKRTTGSVPQLEKFQFRFGVRGRDVIAGRIGVSRGRFLSIQLGGG